MNKKIYNKINAKYPIDFFNIVKSLVKKSLVFKDMFEQMNEKVDSIKLILLYDAIYKFDCHPFRKLPYRKFPFQKKIHFEN